MLKFYIWASETLRRVRRDTEGASLLEYTALLAVILALSIATVIAVGEWAGGVWETLNTQLQNIGDGNGGGGGEG